MPTFNSNHVQSSNKQLCTHINQRLLRIELDVPIQMSLVLFLSVSWRGIMTDHMETNVIVT